MAKDGKHFSGHRRPEAGGQSARPVARGQGRLDLFRPGASALEHLFSDPPDLLVVDGDLPDMPGVELIRLIKGENVYRQLPVVLCLKDESVVDDLDFSNLEIDDFVVRPLSPATVKGRLILAYHRSTRELDASPLTKLPGNTSIIHRIQDLIDRREDFALAYIDLDHFKSFNDKYGFSRGTRCC